MKDLKQLPEVANRSLAGLTADQNLKYRILQASRTQTVKHHVRVPAWVPALCCALVLAVGVMMAIPGVMGPGQLNNDAGVVLHSQRAGDATDAPRVRADLPDGSVQLTGTGSVPGYRSIWSSSDGGSFPLIGVNGLYYRMLDVPSAVDSSLLGSSVGTVAEYTTEPSLSGTDLILSNCVNQGETVYAVSGMDGTLVIAQVDGVYRVFQRVSFNGNSIKGSEDLADTLQVSGQVRCLELSDVGTVTDSAVAEELVSTLLSNAVFESSGTVSGSQSLLIELNNGFTVQMVVKDDKLGACGTWSCPEFFDAFTLAMGG